MGLPFLEWLLVLPTETLASGDVLNEGARVAISNHSSHRVPISNRRVAIKNGCSSSFSERTALRHLSIRAPNAPRNSPRSHASSCAVYLGKLFGLFTKRELRIVIFNDKTDL
uniref:Putative secreted protein n=1 Tax=Ixodes ricinus TaxID=34613 RepID=A0A6B0UJQ9_IXORI